MGAPENRIGTPNGICPDAPGLRSQPGTWTRAHHSHRILLCGIAEVKGKIDYANEHSGPVIPRAAILEATGGHLLPALVPSLSNV